MIKIELDDEHAKEIVKEVEKQFLRKPMQGFLRKLQEAMKVSETVVCGNKCPSGYMPDCSYARGHSGVCEGQYDSAMVDRLNAEKGR